MTASPPFERMNSAFELELDRLLHSTVSRGWQSGWLAGLSFLLYTSDCIL